MPNFQAPTPVPVICVCGTRMIEQAAIPTLITGAKLTHVFQCKACGRLRWIDE